MAAAWLRRLVIPALIVPAFVPASAFAATMDWAYVSSLDPSQLTHPGSPSEPILSAKIGPISIAPRSQEAATRHSVERRRRLSLICRRFRITVQQDLPGLQTLMPAYLVKDIPMPDFKVVIQSVI